MDKPSIDNEAELCELLQLALPLFNDLSETKKKTLQPFLPKGDFGPADIDKLSTDVPRLLSTQNGADLVRTLSATFPVFANVNTDDPVDRDRRALNVQRRLQYEKFTRHYHVKLLEKILTNRRDILRSSAGLTESETSSRATRKSTRTAVRRNLKKDVIWTRTAKRAKFTFQDVRDIVDTAEISSDEDEPDTPPGTAKPSDFDLWRVQRVSDAMKGTVSGDDTLNKHMRDVALHQVLDIDCSDRLVEAYRLLRASQPDHPSLEFADITLAQVVQRAAMDGYLQKVAPSLVKVLLPQPLGGGDTVPAPEPAAGDAQLEVKLEIPDGGSGETLVLNNDEAAVAAGATELVLGDATVKAV